MQVLLGGEERVMGAETQPVWMLTQVPQAPDMNLSSFLAGWQHRQPLEIGPLPGLSDLHSLL